MSSAARWLGVGSNRIAFFLLLLGLAGGLAACASHEGQVNDNYMYVPSRPPAPEPPVPPQPTPPAEPVAAPPAPAPPAASAKPPVPVPVKPPPPKTGT